MGMMETNSLQSRSAECLEHLSTPALVLDAAKMERNFARLSGHLATLGVVFRPHVKTAKSIEVVRHLFPKKLGPITVSTIKEAEYFADAGITDMVYAVGLAPDKIPRVLALRERGVDIAVVLDSSDQAKALAHSARPGGPTFAALIEIDCDGHRGGLTPDDMEIVRIAGILQSGGVEVRGVLTHAGESYSCRNGEGLKEAAEAERSAAVAAAALLRRNGFASTQVSVGSTPTAHFTQDLSGVTEVRAGVFIFFDLVMHGIGVCAIDDIALSVMATVIGRKPEKGWILIDAGWMALSRDRGTARQAVDQGYGLVCDIDGTPYPDVLVTDASQEHGTVSIRAGSDRALPDLPIGARVRILPNHACATAAQHDQYRVVRSGSRSLMTTWPRMRGW